MADHPADRLTVGQWVRYGGPGSSDGSLGRLLGHPPDRRQPATVTNYWQIDFGDCTDVIFWGWLAPCQPSEEEEAAWLLKKLTI